MHWDNDIKGTESAQSGAIKYSHLFYVSERTTTGLSRHCFMICDEKKKDTGAVTEKSVPFSNFKKHLDNQHRSELTALDQEATAHQHLFLFLLFQMQSDRQTNQIFFLEWLKLKLYLSICLNHAKLRRTELSKE